MRHFLFAFSTVHENEFIDGDMSSIGKKKQSRLKIEQLLIGLVVRLVERV